MRVDKTHAMQYQFTVKGIILQIGNTEEYGSSILCVANIAAP